MKTKVKVKVCGLTNREDVELAADLGARFLGFIFYEKSPRSIDRETFRQLRPHLPSAERVYVQVRPDPEELREARGEGFAFFQMHFSIDEDLRLIEEWAEIVSPKRLWLAPRIPPGRAFRPELLSFAETFLIDTFDENRFGGTGQTGDWKQYRDWAETWPDKLWILAGGLNPRNIEMALKETNALAVDVNSGVEAEPGKKDPVLMRAFFRKIALEEES